MIVFIWKVNKFFINKFFVSNSWTIINHCNIRIISWQPCFSFFNFFFAENQLDCIIILSIDVMKFDFMFYQVLEVFSCFLIIWSSQTFVIFDCPTFNILYCLNPVFKVIHCIKRYWLISFEYFEQGCNKLFNKTCYLKQTRPKIMNKVNDQSLNMWSICILIWHDHNSAIS